MKVLAVDDNPDNIALITDIVATLGHEVIRAFDGPQALAAVEKQPPDLILLDVNMPGMTGFEVIGCLKENPETAQIPVILLTALSGVDHRVEGLGLGADDYLTKPFSPRELIARIETRLRAKTHTDGLVEARRAIQQTFERFVSPTVVQKLLEDPQSIKLGGQLQEVTVFFADIENFTATAEYAEPQELLNVLNCYHELIVEVVQQHQGTVDKFIGDGMMALFNTPLQLNDHPACAVRAACQIRDILPNFHQQFVSDFQMNINFGIHTGMAIVGNVGAPQIMDFTAVGDTVNVAARLQALGNAGQILISEATYKRVESEVNAKPIGLVNLKGRSSQIMTYDVLAMLDEKAAGT